MNERQLISTVRQALDESAQHLPLRVTHRLEQARKAALAPLRESPAARPTTRPVERAPAEASPYLPWRITAVVLPAVVLVGGLLLIDNLLEQRAAVEIAELEAALLVDDIPIAAYADPGFGAYLRKTSLTVE